MAHHSDGGMLETSEDLVRASGYKIRYAPLGAAKDLFYDKSPEVLIAGPKGTGKSLAVLQKIHLLLCKYPNARFFMARKTRTSMTNSCLETFQRQVLRPPDKVRFHKQDQQFLYPNGSILAVIGLDNIDRLNSSNWDGGFIQEVTEAEENDWEIASACIRFGVMPYNQLIGDCNPDRPTHWIKKKCDEGKVKMLLSVHQDNPRLWNRDALCWTQEGERYLARLKKMTGVRLSRLFHGVWAAAEGMVYEDWDPQIHMVSLASLPQGWQEWPHYWVLDWGFIHPLVWCDWIEAPNGDLYRLRELYQTKYLVEDAARYIMELNQGIPPPRAIICDHDAEDRATFERHTGMLTIPAYKNIQMGVQAVQNRLKSGESGHPSLFYVRDALVSRDDTLLLSGKPTCTEEEYEGYVWDEKMNRLVNSKKDELPVDRDNHGMDNTRYMVSFADSLADDPQDFEGTMVYDDAIAISPY